MVCFLLQVLPVLISALPLKEDLEESEIVYGCLYGLVFSGHSEVHFLSLLCWLNFIEVIFISECANLLGVLIIYAVSGVML